MFFRWLYSTQPGWKFGKKDDAGSQLSGAFGKALPVGLSLRDPFLLFQILWAKAHNLVADPLVWIGRVSGSVMFGVV